MLDYPSYQAVDRVSDIPRAITEAIRLESPVQGFSRSVPGRARIDGVAVTMRARREPPGRAS